MTARADLMRLYGARHERGLLRVTTNANVRIRRKFVRFVTTQTRVVVRRLGSDRLRMAARARRDCNVGWRMRLMTIRTSHTRFVVCMSKDALGMTARAIFDDDRRRVMKLMTVETIDRRMRGDGSRMRLSICVTRKTRRRLGVGRESMTRHAVGLERGIALMGM